MPMMQEDIRRHYEVEWRQKSDGATSVEDLGYSYAMHDRAVYPRFARLIDDVGIRVNGGRVLDVGCGSGRWVRYFLEHFRPRRVVGVDFTEASIELLRRWHGGQPGLGAELDFRVADITEPDLDLGERFDLVNVHSVLFHIPEDDLHYRAMQNLARHVDEGGCIVTTEYMPRGRMRTEWMLVRSRYEFESIADAVGLRIAEIRPCNFLAASAMGIDGPPAGGVRGRFQKLWGDMQHILKSVNGDEARAYFEQFFEDLDTALIEFARERIAPIDLPGTKLVVLRPKR